MEVVFPSRGKLESMYTLLQGPKAQAGVSIEGVSVLSVIQLSTQSYEGSGEGKSGEKARRRVSR